MNTTRITLDMLNQDSVSILKQEFDENGNQVGYNIRKAYMNSLNSRKELQQELPEDKWQELIAVWRDKPTIEEPDFKPPVITIEDRKTKLINKMSDECNRVITAGFDMELDDHQTYHFSLEIEDQLKIQALALKVQSGETNLPYHADGEPCRFFSAQEILNLNNMMEHLITYHTTYFNSLRTYIQSIEDEASLEAITYGIEIPEEYQSDVLKVLLSEMISSPSSEAEEQVNTDSSETREETE